VHQVWHLQCTATASLATIGAATTDAARTGVSTKEGSF